MLSSVHGYEYVIAQREKKNLGDVGRYDKNLM